MGTPGTPVSPGRVLAQRAEIASLACAAFWQWSSDPTSDVDTKSPEAFNKLFRDYAARWVNGT